ncbi:hypothetical protein ACO0QE_000268 [Hanseniaspora vineae]
MSTNLPFSNDSPRYASAFHHPIFKAPFKLVLSFFSTSSKPHDLLVSLSSMLFALALLFFLDAVMYSHRMNASDIVHISFIDWVPFMCSLIGLCIVNSVNKGYLVGNGENGGASGSNFLVGGGGGGIGGDGRVMREVKIFLFLGFAFLGGGCSGSIVILIIKYVNKGIVEWPTVGMGVDCVVSNGLILLSCMVLWIAQTARYNSDYDEEYNYSLTI